MVRVWVLLSLHTPVLSDTLNNTRRQLLFHTFQLLWAGLSQRSTEAVVGATVGTRRRVVSNDADRLWEVQLQEGPSCFIQETLSSRSVPGPLLTSPKGNAH